MAQIAQPKSAAFSEEDVCIVSKAAPCAIWAGTKILYSGCALSGPGNSTQASGYNFYSGESDVAPVSLSGWGEIRIPELNQLHQLFVFPKRAEAVARTAYTTLTVSTASGYPAGHGGCSGKIALVHYGVMNNASGYLAGGCSGYALNSGVFTSGLIDVIAIGSQM